MLLTNILLCSLGVGIVSAFEENNKFCISTEPMLLADIEKHVNPLENEPYCEVQATILTVKEEERFIDIMCKDHGGTHKDEYNFFKLRNGELTGIGSYHEICDEKANSFLAWIPYDMILKNYAQELDPKERKNYIAKATDIKREKTELCHFRHMDLVSNISANLFTCVVMIFEDNFYGLDSDINVLVMLQPIMYEIRNVTYSPLVNATRSYKTMIGKGSLKNPSRERKQIYGSVQYAYIEKIKVNISSVYGEKLEKLPLLFERMGKTLELNNNGVGGIEVQTKAYFGRSMDPKNTVKVDVIGQWATHSKQFTADVYEYFNYNIKRFRHEIRHGNISILLIESTEPVFEMPDSTHLTKSTLYTLNEDTEQQYGRLMGDVLNESKVVDAQKLEGGNFSDSSRDKHPYPEFYPWFVAAVLIFGAVLLAAIYGMVRHQSKKEDNRKYKLTGM